MQLALRNTQASSRRPFASLGIRQSSIEDCCYQNGTWAGLAGIVKRRRSD